MFVNKKGQHPFPALEGVCHGATQFYKAKCSTTVWSCPYFQSGTVSAFCVPWTLPSCCTTCQKQWRKVQATWHKRSWMITQYKWLLDSACTCTKSFLVYWIIIVLRTMRFVVCFGGGSKAVGIAVWHAGGVVLELSERVAWPWEEEYAKTMQNNERQKISVALRWAVTGLKKKKRIYWR